MDAKLFEIRDRGTVIGAVGIRVSWEDGERARWDGRTCFSDPLGKDVDVLILVDLKTARGCFDPYSWDTRTMRAAHDYIALHWDTLPSGAVVDVEIILGETFERSRE